uniref:Uncharacterized protein n=1 Tax=Peronospora matthiolae TaxID=2874970 RepID=A0AAV1TPA5_9STRA
MVGAVNPLVNLPDAFVPSSINQTATSTKFCQDI